MIGYAAAMGRGAGLENVKRCGWRLLVSPENLRGVHGLPYALDNGAWPAFQRGERLNLDKFLRAFEKVGAGADFVVLPDIVCGGGESLDLSLRWLEILRGQAAFLIAVQDGFCVDEVKPFLSVDVGVFVGGDTVWKLETMGDWARVAHGAGGVCHVGRVNTSRRVRACEIAGVDSFDGSGVSRFPSEMRRIDFARRQVDMFRGVGL